MLKSKLIYIFADPFSRSDSGVSAYINYARVQLSENKIKSHIIQKDKKESISDYQKRLSFELTSFKKKDDETLVLEAPESYAVSKLVPTDLANIHIRFHGSHLLGKKILGNRLNLQLIEEEQREIDRAKFLSAPSESAVIASSSIFQIPKNISYYPNAAPNSINIKTKESLKKISDDKYVIYIGRIHDLKGAAWLKEIAKELPHIKFQIICPPDQRMLSRIPNLTYLSSKISKAELFSQAKLVIVPSLYETASMVGIEAISAGIPVLTWEHIGLTEYANEQMVKKVTPFRIDEFIKMIDKEACNVNVKEPNINKSTEINKSFMEGLTTTLSGRNYNLMLIKLTQEKKKLVLRTINSFSKKNLMIKTTLPPWKRKLRKLVKNPKSFLKDSFFMRIFIKPGKGFQESIVKQNSVKKLVLKSKDKIEITKDLPFIEITNEGPIYCKEPPKKPIGLRIAFLYSENDEDYAESILQDLSNFKDFKRLHRPHLQVGTFRDNLTRSVANIVQSIDLSNKQKISSLDHIILLNPPEKLCTALHCCGSNQRIIVIVTNEESKLPNPLHTNVLIILGAKNAQINSNEWRRVIKIYDDTSLSLAIRRSVQEGIPKSPDLFLPILGLNKYCREDLLNIDSRYHQGLIHLPNDFVFEGKSISNHCELVAEKMIALAITESCYLSYRNLFDNFDELEARINFLKFSLFDGVLFDVKA